MKKYGALLALFALVGGTLLPVVTNATEPTNVTLEDGLVGHWTFDGSDVGTKIATNSGSYGQDWNGQLQDGNIVNIVEEETPGFGGVLRFSPRQNAAKGMHIDGQHKINAKRDNFTFSAWIKLIPNGPRRAVIFQQTGSAPTILNVENDGRYTPYFHRQDNTYITNPTPADEWQIITFTKRNIDSNSAEVKGYVNGQLQKTLTLPIGNAVDLATDLWVGRHKDATSPAGQFQGSLDDLRFYNRAINAEEAQALYTIRNIQTPETILTVNPDTVRRNVERSTFGINHRYAFNGYGSFDPVTMRVRDQFAQLYSEAGFGSLRYPGGTISNLFNWKTSIGPVNQRILQMHGFYNNPNQHGIMPNFGLTEAATFAQEQGSEMVYVYALGRGDAHDAADLMEYMNAPVGSNPNGGTAWAEVRKANGHEQPFNVRYIEIGNEMNLGGNADGRTSQKYWTTAVTGGNLVGYIHGGLASFTKQYVVNKDDWNQVASFSDGTANQVKYLRYARVPADTGATYRYGENSPHALQPESVEVFVNDVQWQVVPVNEMSTQTATATVVGLDTTDGSLHFGDGTHGAIPPNGQQIKASYQVLRDGLKQVSQSMRDTMRQINEARNAAGMTPIEIKIYAGFESRDFVNRMNADGLNNLYDGLTIHPYSGRPSGGSANTNSQHTFYYSALSRGDNKAEHVKAYADLLHSVDPTKVPVISEFGIYNSTDPMVRSQTHAVYIARAIMDYVAAGSPYIQKHCLVDWYSNGADALGPTQQAVIQAVPQTGASTVTGDGDFKYFATPSARVFQMIQSEFGTRVVDNTFNRNPGIPNNVKKYKAMSSLKDNGDLSIIVVNSDADQEGPLKIAINGIDLTGKEMLIQTLTSPTITSENTLESPNNVAVTRRQSIVGTDVAAVVLPAHSVNMITFRSVVDPITPPEPSETPGTPSDPGDTGNAPGDPGDTPGTPGGTSTGPVTDPAVPVVVPTSPASPSYPGNSGSTPGVTPGTPGGSPAKPGDPGGSDNTGGSGSGLVVERWSGPDRVATSLATWKNTSGSELYLAGVLGEVDALTGSVPAALSNTSVVYTYSTHLPQELVDTLKTRKITSATILGGTRVVSEVVANQLRSLGINVSRLSGSDRYQTAKAIAGRVAFLRSEPVLSNVVIADGVNLADALVAGPLAVKQKAAVLITQGEVLPPASTSFLGPNIRVMAVGGPSVRALRGSVGLFADASFVMGRDRFETSVMVANKYFADAKLVGMANGDAPADAVVGASYMASQSVPLVLSNGVSLTPGVKDVLARCARVIIFGGASRISSVLEQAIRGL